MVNAAAITTKKHWLPPAGAGGKSCLCL